MTVSPTARPVAFAAVPPNAVRGQLYHWDFTRLDTPWAQVLFNLLSSPISNLNQSISSHLQSPLISFNLLSSPSISSHLAPPVPCPVLALRLLGLSFMSTPFLPLPFAAAFRHTAAFTFEAPRACSSCGRHLRHQRDGM